MLTMALVVAVGTVIESNYNAEYAKLMVYGSPWFLALLALLFINILNATLSRYPYKRHHLGFVITHIGLLTLLTGAMITSRWGVDGSLRVAEGSENGTVVLPRLMIAYQFQGTPRPQTVIFDRFLREQSGSNLDFINSEFNQLVTVEKLIPFASIEKEFVQDETAADQVALSFILKSSFFNVSEWLHSSENPEMQMGPATLRLVVEKNFPSLAAQSRDQSNRGQAGQKFTKPQARAKPAVKSSRASGQLTIVAKELKSQKVIGRWKANKMAGRPVKVGSVEIRLKQLFQRATVAENKLVEGPTTAALNIAAELEVKQANEALREVLYAKFPGFSLNNNGLFGMTLALEGAAAETEASESSSDQSEVTDETPRAGSIDQPNQPSGNVIEFHVAKDQPNKALVRLYKGSSKVAEQELAAGESFQTPWMGIKVYLGSLIFGGRPQAVAKTVSPEKSKELPPSAAFIKTQAQDKGFWLVEGESRQVTLAGRPAEIYFGRETLELPFRVHLLKFNKTDYPGTQTPMSFMSQVRIAGLGDREISMNEPLKHMDYTIYQASYIMVPNQVVESVFSVNHDPGRGVKYAGSLILALGIIIYTFMRSRLARPKGKG